MIFFEFFKMFLYIIFSQFLQEKSVHLAQTVLPVNTHSEIPQIFVGFLSQFIIALAMR